MNLPPASAQYDRENEQAARNELEQAAGQALQRDAAEHFLQLIDQVTGEPGKLTVESGVITWTPA